MRSGQLLLGMRLILLLSDSVSPYAGIFTFLFAAIAWFVLVGIALLITGVQLLKQGSTRKLGYWLIVAGLVVPVLGFLACW
jgi:hypothetical protein